MLIKEFDAILLDAPCSATGTIRRHPDVPWRKQPEDIATLATLQRAMLARAAELLKAGGVLVYCVCSLEPEEGVGIVTDFLAGNSGFRRRPISASEISGIESSLTPAGDLRTLPCGLPDPDPRMAGLDGFFAARIERVAFSDGKPASPSPSCERDPAGKCSRTDSSRFTQIIHSWPPVSPSLSSVMPARNAVDLGERDLGEKE